MIARKLHTLRRSGTMVACVLAVAGLVSAGPGYAADKQPAATVADAEPNMAALIVQVADSRTAQLKLTAKQAVAQMDPILANQYRAGKISSEPNAELKSFYYQAARLLMNGYPIAGGTLVSLTRNKPAFANSAAGRGLASFTDAMLSPTEDDDEDMVTFMRKAKAARQVIMSLRPALRLAAQLKVIGAIYRDDIAVEAGTRGLAQAKATPAELAIVERAAKAQ